MKRNFVFFKGGEKMPLRRRRRGVRPSGDLLDVDGRGTF